MPSSVRRVFFADYAFDIWENVYEPAEDSFLFAENLVLKQGDYVLDMGTGCGILGVIAAAKAAKVVGVDINPQAVLCAKQNSRLNHVSEKMLFVQGDLFAPLKSEGKFDLILFNAPYLPIENEDGNSWFVRAWSGGETGRLVIDRFISEFPKHLRSGGRVLLMQSTLSDVDKTVKSFVRQGLLAEIIAKCDLPFFETIVLLEAKNLEARLKQGVAKSA
ncbi:MAG TPA: HemK2/MTQ2 family protein methyltransferase [Candidatus Acidoferrum sp.]|jgi:release factor glutamine methyltransferase|nr:HemK2/MTQ2 family protein methyltransferase [Candidatus Acidoferrum sp.]